MIVTFYHLRAKPGKGEQVLWGQTYGQVTPNFLLWQQTDGQITLKTFAVSYFAAQSHTMQSCDSEE